MVEPAAFIGRSEAIARVLERIERAAQVDVPVLLTGETGTGKSLLAKILHAKSRRSARPLVSANCAAIPESLFESEMFGHVRGAFTGAIESRVGLFEEAHLGTLFLDELGELPLLQQAKLLTVIEEREVRPVGAPRAKKVDVRIVSATSRDLHALCAGGEFRIELYHRIALIRCEIPPLRERPEDLRELAAQLLRALARKYKRSGLELSTDAWTALLNHAWPGNVRELSHVLEAAVVLNPSRVLDAKHLRRPLEASPTGTAGLGSVLANTPSKEAHESDAKPSHRYSFFGVADDEREAIRAALVQARGNRTHAAKALGMSRNTLIARVRQYGL